MADLVVMAGSVTPAALHQFRHRRTHCASLHPTFESLG